MAINSFLSIPDWISSLTFTQSTVPNSGSSRIYPGPDGYWYVFSDSNIVKRLAFDVQYGNGFENIVAPTESFTDFRVDLNIGSGLTFSYDGIGSEVYVTGLTSGSLLFTNTFTQGYFLSTATSGAFEWVTAGFSGTTGSIPKFNTNSTLGDSILREASGQITIGSSPIFVSGLLNIGTSSATGSGSLLIQDKIYLGDNQYRFLGISNSNDIELNLSRNFILNSYTGVTGPSGPYFNLLEARTNQTTYEKNLNFLSGLVSVNLESPITNGQWSLQKPQLFVQSSDSSPTFSFTSSLFLGYISGPTGLGSNFKTILGLSGGGIQIIDGSEGVGKVLVSSTTAGHGIWATMVATASASRRLPFYLNSNDFRLVDVLTTTEIVPNSITVGSFSRTYNVNLNVDTQQLRTSLTPSNSSFGTGTFSVSFNIPNISATQSDFVMNKSSQTIYGTKVFLDENETFGLDSTTSGRFVKDLSNTTIGPSAGGTYAYALGQRSNSFEFYLNSDRGSSLLNKKIQWAWIPLNYSIDKPVGYYSSYGTFSSSDVSLGPVFNNLSAPGYKFFHRSVFVDSVVWQTPTDFMTTNNVTSTEKLPNRYTDPTSVNGYIESSRSFNYQIVRKKNTLFYNSIGRDDVMNLTYNFDFSKMGYTGSLTSNVLNMNTMLGYYLRLESGEFSGSLTQSTGLYVNPQFGGFSQSNLSMTASRQVGIQVSQEVGYLRYKPAGFIREAYDYISGRITNGSTQSGIASHIGFFAQSKLVGTQWDPFGRRTYDFGQSAPLMQGSDRLIAGYTVSGRTTPLSWPTFSTYDNKPWGFFAEKDKSNLGGGLMIDIGATFGTSLRGYLDIQGLTAVYNSSLSTEVIQDLDGSWIAVNAQSFGPILPQISLRPSPSGLTPTGLTDGFMWYKSGTLNFYDNGQTYNLLQPPSTGGGGGGLTGFGIVGNVPIWIGTSDLKGTSSIFVSNNGDGNVGISLRNFITPEYSLQVHTSSLSPTIALGLSGSILYQDGTNGITGSVLMADSNGKTFLYPLILPAPGVTASFSRVGATVGSGYLPLYMGLGNTSGASSSSEHQLGPIYTDEFGNKISLLIRGQNVFSQNFASVANRNLTLTVPQLSGAVPGTSSGVIEFLMDYGNQTVYGQKSFDNRTRFQLEGLTAGEGNIGLLNLLSTTNTNQNQRIVAQGRPFRRSNGTPNYGKSILTLLTGTYSNIYSRVNLNDSLSSDDGAVFWSSPYFGYNRNYQTVIDQVIGRYTESVLANNFTTVVNGKENILNFVGQFDFTKISSTESNLNNPQTFIGTYKRTEFGHDLATQSSNWVISSPTASSNRFGTSSVNLLTGLFVNNQVGGLSWSYGSATYSIGVYTRQDVDNGLITNAFDFFSSRMSSTSSLSRIYNHIGFYAQSKVFGPMLEPTGRQGYLPTTPWNTTSSFGWTNSSNMPWGFWSDTDKSNLGGGLMVDIGATFGSSLTAWLDIQGLTGVYNTFSFTRTMTDINGQSITVSGTSWGPILPQLRLRPSLSTLTPSSVDGSMWYKSGSLNFVDGGNVYNLLQVPTFLPFSQNDFFPNGLTSIGGDFKLGAAGTAGPGLVHTGSQTFSGNKTFVDNVFFGPTSGKGNGLFFYDDSTTRYTGFVGPTGLPANVIYRLPSGTPTNNFYLKVIDVSGSNYTLGWATAQGAQGAAGPAGTSPGTVSLSGINNSGYNLGASVSVANSLQIFTFGAATEQFFGVVSTVSQNFGGTKSFRDSIFIGSTATNTSTSQPTRGIFFNDTLTFSENFTGFVGPTQALGSNLVYILPSATPSVTGNNRQFLTLRSNSTGVSTQTYSLDWFTLDPTPNLIVNLPGTFSGSTFTVSTADNGKMFDINTGVNAIFLSPPTFPSGFFTASPRDVGFEFRVRKNDSGIGVVAINIPEIGGTASTQSGAPFSHLRRQNQTMEFKWNSSSQSWSVYTIDMGYIQPNTVLGNFNTEVGYAEDYEVVDYNDSSQNALNYTQGAFVNDWLSGVIYSSIDPLSFATTFSVTESSLLNTRNNQYIGINTPGNPGSGISIPGFALTRGKHLRVRMSGTYSKAPSSQAGFQFLLGNQILSVFTYSIGAIRATASFDIEYNLKVRYGGASGSVYGFGSMNINQVTNDATTYLLSDFNRGYTDVNLASTAVFDVRILNQSGQLGVTINSSTIERLA